MYPEHSYSHSPVAFTAMQSYPHVASGDDSPSNDAFSYTFHPYEKVYLANTYLSQSNIQTDRTLTAASFLETDSFFDRSSSSVELPVGFAPKTQAAFAATLYSAANSHSNLYRPAEPSVPSTSSASSLSHFPSDFSFTTGSKASFESGCVFSHSQFSRSPTPSLCEDGSPIQQQVKQSHKSPEPSPVTLIKQEASPPTSPTSDDATTVSPISDDTATISPAVSPFQTTSSLARSKPKVSTLTSKRPQRKRGRPKMEPNPLPNHLPDTNTAPKSRRPSRLPHNQVERKYREGLNSELERLRRAVPTLPQYQEDEGVAGGCLPEPKPSKAMVLAGAIEYIERLTRERDSLSEENERLRGVGESMRPGAGLGRGGRT